MSSATTTADEALIKQARSALATVTQQLLALPDEGDVATPNEQQRVWQKRQTLNAQHRHISALLNRFTDLSPRFEPLRQWRDTLLAVSVEFKKMLGEFEALTDADSRTVREAERVRESLRIIDFGPGGGREFTPDILYNRLLKHGAKSEQGLVFNGRGGLVSVEAQLVALDKDYADARRALVSALVSAGVTVQADAATVSKG